MRDVEIWYINGWKYMTLEHGVGWKTRMRHYMLHLLETKFNKSKDEARRLLTQAQEKGSINVKRA